MVIKSILLIIIVLMYFLLSYYIGVKVKTLLLHFKIKYNKWIYWPIYWFIALSYVISTVIKITFASINIITIIGIVYISMFIYCVILFLIVDLFKIILRKAKLNKKSKLFLKKLYCNGLSVFLVVIIIVGFGFFNAQNKHITNYEVNIRKNAGNNNSLNIVMVSDAHIGLEVREKAIDNMVNSINKLNPDLVVFCGDIYDESTSEALKKYSSEKFKLIKSKYGIYGVTGNHEYYAGNINDIFSNYEKGKVKLLNEESIKVDNSFYIAGRVDKEDERVTNKKRKQLSEILKSKDESLPVILLNHRPEDIDESVKENVDLQLSGHTHKGQLIPGNIITSLINEKDYGYLKKDMLNLIVSSGYGTWGFPIRIGSKSEIVNIKVDFNKN